jgi:hypothetical protein
MASPLEGAIYQLDNTLTSSNGEVNGAIKLVDADGTALLLSTLTGSATYDPASLADGAGATTTVTVTGAALGDFALASFSLDLQGILLTAYVSAADTVSVRFQNETTGTIDLGSGTLRARVLQQAG